MFEQAMFSAIFFFSIFVVGKYLLKLYDEHIKRLDESNNSLKDMANNMNEIVSDKRKRAEALANRKIEADKRKAYQQGKKEAIVSGKVTPIRANVNSYQRFKDGESNVAEEQPVEYNHLQPVEYNRNQNF